MLKAETLTRWLIGVYSENVFINPTESHMNMEGSSNTSTVFIYSVENFFLSSGFVSGGKHQIPVETATVLRTDCTVQLWLNFNECKTV